MTPNLPSYGPSSATFGSGNAYGSIPSSIAQPASNFQQASGVLPGLPGLTQQAGNVVGSELSGNLSPGTLNLLGTQAAERGVGSGMPGSGLSTNDYLRSVGLTSEALTQTGVQQYGQLLTSIGNQQLDPSLQNNVNQYNSTMGAAPDPAAANAMLQQLLQPPAPNNPAIGNNDMSSYFTPYGQDPNTVKLPIYS